MALVHSYPEGAAITVLDEQNRPCPAIVKKARSGRATIVLLPAMQPHHASQEATLAPHPEVSSSPCPLSEPE